MIICGQKNTGKRLIRKISQEIVENGYSEVAALSTLSIERLKEAGQKVANTMKEKIKVTADKGEVELDGKFRLALVVRFEIDNGEENEKN